MKLTKRDILSEDRTHLANERTLLAYWRTALAFLVLGAFFIKFITSPYSQVFAFASIIFGVFLFIYGSVRYFVYRKKIVNQIRD